jgi:ferredoxin
VSTVLHLRLQDLDDPAQARTTKLLDACIELDLKVPFGCTIGKCGVCAVELLEGELAEPSRYEAAVLEGGGYPPRARLACQARLVGDVVVKPYSKPIP